jgi:xanthine dehydrogenase accessory factor
VSNADEPVDVLRFAIDAYGHGSVALATLVEIKGGAARALGAHVAVTSDGAFCGYLSGGCVEAAVATEALLAMQDGCDRTIAFGKDSGIFDIVLPCGGSVKVALHLLRDVEALLHVLEAIKRRERAGMIYSPEQQRLIACAPPDHVGWSRDGFRTLYSPRTRLFVAGQAGEIGPLSRIALAAGYELRISASATLSGIPPTAIDRFTAIVLLHHDLEAEAGILQAALSSNAFYIGALGSTRTHQRRIRRLKEAGWKQGDIERIRAPIGLFGPTRDATSLAVSILADIVSARLAPLS